MVTPRTPTPIQQDTSVEAIIPARAIDLAVHMVSPNLPNISNQNLQNLFTMAQNNNQRDFIALATRINIPEPAEMFRTFRLIVEGANQGEAAITAIIDSELKGDRSGVRRHMGELRTAGDNLSGIAAVGAAHGFLLIEMNDRYIEKAKENNIPPEQIDQGRRDMARAALEMGFTVPSVLSVFGDLAGLGRDRTGQQRGEAFQELLREAAVLRSQDLMQRMREMQQEMDGTRDSSKRRRMEEEYRQMLAEYGRLTGHTLATTVADRWLRNPEEAQPTEGGRRVTLTAADMEQSVRDETRHLIDLHNHNLGNVVPVPTERRAA